jgi:hypothetical protein
MVCDGAEQSPPPGRRPYRVNLVEKASGEKFVKQVTASDPDDAIGRVMDQVTQGLMEPEEFWDAYGIQHVIAECAGKDSV